MTWRRAGDVLIAKREPTEEEQHATDYVLETADWWERGTLPLDRAESETTPRDRFDAVRFGRRDDPRYGALLRMIDAIVVGQGHMPTNQGVLPRETIAAHAGVVKREDGKTTVTFPVKVVNGMPIYPRKDELGPVVRPFTAVPGPKPDDSGRYALDL